MANHGPADESTSGQATGAVRRRRELFRGALPVLRKEAIHIRRDPMALFVTVLIPIIQMFTIGFAIDTNVRQTRTAVLDSARTQESRRLIDRFVNSDDFRLMTEVGSEKELNDEIVAGRASVGLHIPADYSRRLLAGQSATFLVLVDGSDSSVASQSLNIANAIALRESLERAATITGQLSPLGRNAERGLPVEARPKILFNPDSRSANFLIPGMLAVLIQIMTVMLTALAIVRERERGTLEQLYMTPVRPLGLMIGKIVPYAAVAYAELGIMIFCMRWIFKIPINGSLPLLLVLVIPFLITMLGLGLLISTRAQSQQEAIQAAFGTMLPSIFLSGYIFPIDTMPLFFQAISAILPTTYLIQIFRAIILRGAGFEALWKQTLILSGMGLLLITISALRFKKKTS
jgi:ABC-2 type transport system permease protein